MQSRLQGMHARRMQPTNVLRNQCVTRIQPCRSVAPTRTDIPHELPLFPVQPMGVFLPGMTKTLHLYEPHFISMVDECLASEHKLMATAVLEPFMGEAAEGEAGPGAFVGGYNFSLSCGCLVQVLSAKPYTGGYLVRIRGEARLGISGLPQTGPYMRAQVYPLPDQAPDLGPAQQEELRTKVAQLQDVMRDVQNLSSKFRCDETAALQQAMRWLYATPITPAIQQVGTQTHGSLPVAASDWEEPSAASSGRDGADATTSSSSSSSTPTSSSSSSAGAAGSPLAARVPSEGLPASTDAGDGGGNGAPASPSALSAAHCTTGRGADGEEADPDAEVFDPEEAVRLSWAALQWLPHSSPEERVYIVRTRLLAMDTRDVGRRLDLALEAMGRARASLAAKCAIKTI